MLLSLAACATPSVETTSGGEEQSTTAEVSTTSQSEHDRLFTAGTYTGSAFGRCGEIIVEVTFDADKIQKIEVKEHSETANIFAPAEELITEDILTYQALNVDTVAGATLSSNGILNAVKDCVEQAGGNVDDLMAEIPVESMQETLSADVVIVGGGGAGLSAALEAVEQGASVILVEAQGMVGGSTGLSTGMLLASATEDEKTQHAALTLEDMINALKVYGSEYYDINISTAFLSASQENQKWIMGLAEEAGHELGIAYEPGFVPFEPENPDGEWLKAEYTVAMTETQNYIDTQIDGPLGFWITDGLYEAAMKAGAQIYLNTRAEELLSENGVVTGIKAVNQREGITYTIEAKSVILACGGFGANEEMIAQYNNSAGPYMGAAANDGWGILAAEELGAKLRFATVPFFEEYPEIYNSIGGVIINDKAQVLDETDQPIAGLYSAGEMACVIVMDPPHIFSGHNNAWGIYSGRLAGAEAAAAAKNVTSE